MWSYLDLKYVERGRIEEGGVLEMEGKMGEKGIG